MRTIRQTNLLSWLMVTVIAASCGAENSNAEFPDIGDARSNQEAGETDDQTSGDGGDGSTTDDGADTDSPADSEEDTSNDLAEDSTGDASDSDAPLEDSDGDATTDGDDATDIEVADSSDLSGDSGDLADETAEDTGADPDLEVAEDLVPETDEDGGGLDPVRLSFRNLESDTVEIWMANDVPIKAYSFIASGITLIGAGGGRTLDAGLNNVSADGTLVTAFALDGSAIPVGEGVLIILEYTTVSTAICLGDPQFSDDTDTKVDVTIPLECPEF